MDSKLMDQLFLMAFIIVIPSVMLSMIIGPILFAVFAAIVILFILNGQYKVRQMEIYSAALIEAAKIASGEKEDNPDPTTP